MDGAVWTTPRGAGAAGYGAAAIALYPDKDAITTLSAVSNPKLSNDFIAQYHGPFTKVTGVVKWQKGGAQNEVTYKDVPRGEPLDPTGDVSKGKPLGPTSAPE